MTAANEIRCPKMLRNCSGPGSCKGCQIHAAIQNRDMTKLREELKEVWAGQPVKATSYVEFMRSLGMSEAEAREMERQEQLLVDQEIARYSKEVQ
jgi:hypothetical protein